MQIAQRIKHVMSLTMMVVFVAYGFARCVSYISYVSNFGLTPASHGYISTIPFMIGASTGDIIAAALIFLGYITGKLVPFSLPYKIPFLAVIITYGFTLAWPEAFTSDASMLGLGLLWGLTSTFISTTVIEFLTYESSPVIIIISLAAGSLLTGSLSILIKIYPCLAGPLDLSLAVVSLLLIGILRKKPWPAKPVVAPRKTLKKTLRLSLAPILASATFELVVGLINMFSFTGASSFQIETDSPILGMLISGVVVTVFVMLVRRAPQEQVVYSVVFPAVIGLILLLPFFGDVLGKTASTLLYSAYLFTSMLSMFCCIQACQKSQDCIYGVMSAFGIMLRLFLVAGLTLGWWLGTLQDAESFMRISLACVICIYLLGLVLVIRNIGKRFLFPPATFEAQALTTEAKSAISSTPVPSTDELGTGKNSPLSLEGAVGEMNSRAFEVLLVAQDSSAVSQGSSDSGQGSSAIAGASQAAATVLASSSGDALTDRLDELTALYGLTNRERDVLAGLAAGNTAASIAKELCLSTSTVQSYTKTLYAKLGLNKKQQVIDLVMKRK